MIKLFKLLPLLLLMYAISIPRFNWRPLPYPLESFVGTKPFDIEQYEKYVEYFRGNINLISELEGPFSYRPLVPYLASFLPFDAITSINLINLLFLSIGLSYLYKLLIQLGFQEKAVIIGLIIFIISFPLFYYATSGYIDSSLIGILLVLNYHLFERKYLKFILLFLIGTLIKETTIIILPVAAIYLILNENSGNKFLKIILPIFIYTAIVMLIRSLAPQKESYVWKPSYEIFIYNISRVKTYLTFLLTLGVPGLLSVYLIFSEKRKSIPKNILIPIVTGFLFSILLWIYSLFAAYSDGRQIWTSHAYTVILSVYLIQGSLNNRPIKKSDNLIDSLTS